MEGVCKPYYAPRMGAPSLPPGRYFRMHMIGYFEGIDSERGIAWRCADSFSLRDFLRLSNRDKVPDHSWLSRTRSRLPHEAHEKVFGFVLKLVAERGLVRGERIGVDGWGVNYDDLEPHYDQFEYLCGTSGQAGNLNGQILEGGNPFEGPRSRSYPTPPQAQGFGHALFATAARELGYKPFPQPSGNLSQAYLNPLGVRMGACSYCGFCEWFGCANSSKASPQTTILPVLLRKSNFQYRAECEVTRINLDASGKRATGVTFVDTSGEEWEQPADLVILAAYSLFNVQLLLLSKIGQPYDPVSGSGVIGRNFTHQTISDVVAFSTRTSSTSIPSWRRAPSGCASTNSMATISTTGRWVSSAAATSVRSRPAAGRSRRRRFRRERRDGARNGRRPSATIISAR